MDERMFPKRLLVTKDKTDDPPCFVSHEDDGAAVASDGEPVAIYKLVGVKRQVIKANLSLSNIPNRE